MKKTKNTLTIKLVIGLFFIISVALVQPAKAEGYWWDVFGIMSIITPEQPAPRESGDPEPTPPTDGSRPPTGPKPTKTPIRPI